MLGRKDYTREELDHAASAIRKQLSAYNKLAEAVRATGDEQAEAALEAFEPLFTRNMTLVLDRYFVHRIRKVTGHDANPLNEVELITESVLAGNGALSTNTVIKWAPEDTVLGLADGDPIEPSAAQFDRLSKAFLGELESRFVS
jgi:acetyl-CoA carboxylase carboxyltransferase component